MRYPDAIAPAGWTLKLCRPTGDVELSIDVAGQDFNSWQAINGMGQQVAKALSERGQLSLLTEAAS